ncbi:MAG: hypothetical protein U0930_20095 [Pirellulales bacterium]
MPSGRVHIEGNIFEFSIGPNASKAEGAVIRIPAGVYDVSLHMAPLTDKNLKQMYFLLTFTPLHRK